MKPRKRPPPPARLCQVETVFDHRNGSIVLLGLMNDGSLWWRGYGKLFGMACASTAIRTLGVEREPPREPWKPRLVP